MKTPLRKVILIAFFGTMLVSSASFGFAKSFSKTQKINETFASNSTRYNVEDPSIYYSGINPNSITLLKDLNSLNSRKRQTTVGYKAALNDPENGFYVTDPGTGNNTITTFYSGKSNKGTGGLNREHVWPESRGGGLVDNDIHMPRPTLVAENGSRGNSFYVEGKCKSSGGWDPAMEDFGIESYRGDSARIIFYCAIANTQLTLVDKEDDNPNNKTMGKLSDLLKWNLKYPVLDREKVRNDGAQSLQGNRNPFIDHPEYACKIWGNTNATTKQICKSQIDDIPSLESLQISGEVNKKEYVEGDSFDPSGLTITAIYSDESRKDVTDEVVWTPTKLTAGNDKVTGTYTENNISKSCTVRSIIVHPIGGEETDVTKVLVNPETVDLDVGESIKVDVTVLPNNAINKKVIYSSNHSNIASVDTNGNITANSVGTATITVKSMQNADIFDKCIVNVSEESDAKVIGIEVVSEPAKTKYYVGQDFTPYGIIVEAEYDDGTTEVISDKVSYECNITIANPNSNVIVKYREFSASFVIEVVDGEPNVEEKAVDYTYEFGETMDKYMMDISDVTETSWLIVEAKYDILDNETKQIFKNATYPAEKKRISKALTNDEIIDCVKTYDKVLTEKPDFDNFMGRNIGPSNFTFDSTRLIIILCLVGFSLLVVIVVAIVIPVAIHKKHKKAKARI